MFIFKILKLKNQLRDTGDAIKDPESFAKETIKGAIWGYVGMFFLSTLTILTALGFIGYGSLLGGPHGLARILFWIVLIPTALITISAFSAYSLIKKGVSSELRKQRSKGKDGSVIDIQPEKPNS